MIPYLKFDTERSPPPPELYESLVEACFQGDVEIRASSQVVYSTDNSIYQLQPACVLFPRGIKDLQAIAAVVSQAPYRGISVAPRGGGTGTNGQSLTSGIVVDCSRHMNRILEIDPVRRVARVEAGVVKDQLNRALKPYGLFFAPELSTSNRATIGGMISTDACGQGSCLYGKTSDHLLGLRIVLMDGTDWWSRPADEATLADLMTRQDSVGKIYRTVDGIAREKKERIAKVFPKINRYMTGYDLAHIYRNDGRFDLNSVLCGSEGTLAMIAEAELNLMPIPSCAALINIRYRDFDAALADARMLTALNVASVETVDEVVLDLAKKDIVWNEIARFFPEEGPAAGKGINIVEILADSETALADKLLAVTSQLDDIATGCLGYTIARGHDDVEAIWAMRKRAVGLLGSVDGPLRPVAFVEDTAVPPENLAAYIREFRALLDEAGLSYGMFGHVDAGVLHVRPALDLTRDDHVLMVREISDAVVALTRKHGGVLWGEHGKGVRSEYVPDFFGDLYPCLQDIKQAFDPDNRLNPGKIAVPSSSSFLKIDAVPMRGETDRVIGNEIRAAYNNATYCNGNGACFDFDETSPMCPSYKATRDRRYSPKGRAMLMREWLRLLADKVIDPPEAARRLRRSNPLKRFASRFINSLDPRNTSDFSHEVRDAMDTCLGCKACAGQCPVKVNVPAFRAKFLELYYGRYLRPLKDPLVAAIETILPLMLHIRPLYNLVVRLRLAGVFGLTALPLLPRTSLKKMVRRLGIGLADLQVLSELPLAERERTVVFVPDAFTACFEPGTVIAAIRLAQKMGLSPLLAVPHVNGKALHVHGYLKRFEAVAEKTDAYLQGIADKGITLVGIDPSMTLTFRSEYKEVPHASKATVLMPQEWLSSNLARIKPGARSRDKSRFEILQHCSERANAPKSLGQWKAVFAHLGFDLDSKSVGCCGMAGTFGHEKRNRPTAERLYAMSWAEPVANARLGASALMATGFSCRSQIKALDSVRVPHPVEVLDGLIQ